MARSFTAEVVNTLNVATQDYMGTVVSQLAQDDVVRARLMKKSKPVDGGKQIGYPLRVAKENVSVVGKYDPYNLQLKEILDEAKFDWKFVTGDMVLAKKDVEIINKGQAQIIDIARTKVENMKDSMNLQFSQLLYSSAATITANSNYMDSLVKICGTKNNTVGGIDAATCVGGSGTIVNSFGWNPNVLDISASAISFTQLCTPTSGFYIEDLLRKQVSQQTVGVDKPTLIIMTQGVWDAYEKVLKTSKRYDSAAMEVDGGFLALKFREIPCVVDNNVPGGQLNTAAANTAYIFVLNENYLGFKHTSAYSSAEGVGMRWTPWHELEQQPVLHSMLEWGGTFGCSKRTVQGAIYGLPTDAQVYA
jgi:hypothetical protein